MPQGLADLESGKTAGVYHVDSEDKVAGGVRVSWRLAHSSSSTGAQCRASPPQRDTERRVVGGVNDRGLQEVELDE